LKRYLYRVLKPQVMMPTSDVKNTGQEGRPPGGLSAVIKASASSLKDDELRARRKADYNRFYMVLINSYSAIFVFVFYLISIESLIGIGLSVGFTIYTYQQTENNNLFDGSSMNWVLLTFAVITPMSASVRMAFSRRELALQQISVIRSTCTELYLAHAMWGWKDRDKVTCSFRVAC